MLSWLMIKISVALWGAGAEEFCPGRLAGGEDRAAAVRSNYGFLIFLEEGRGCIGDSFTMVEFKCLLAAVIGRLEFEQDGNGRGSLVRLRGRFRVNFEN